MILTDTHTHLYAEEFNDDIDQVLVRAKSNHVSRLFLPNIDSASIAPMLQLEQNHPDYVFCMMGLHPCSVKENYKQELELVSTWLAKRHFVAVGEIGIDLYWDKTFEKEQIEAFVFQIELALKYDLPIVIHTRNSFEQTLDIVKQHYKPGLRGIFHCFSGNLQQARQVIDLGGFKLGIGGVLTFKNSGLQEVVKHLELKDLVLETDSPYLAPVPHRGKRNESAYVFQVAQKLASIFNLSVEQVAEVTTQNSKEIFLV
jgi:TatD DNase family protein